MKDQGPRKLACYRLSIDENDDATGIDAISLVEDPAIKVDFISFSSDEKPKQQDFKFKVANAEKRMLAGVFMSAEQPIYRVDPETGEEYYVIFTAEDIEKCVKKFFKKNNNSSINKEHDELTPGCYVVDSWFMRDDTSNPLASFGFNNVKKGDWVGTIAIDDEKLWNDYVKTGKIKGFSIQGMFKFSKKTLINSFKAEYKDQDFTFEELMFIGRIADILLNDEDTNEI
ncbi:MAG TPA: XkdF-like putative serine protease domain-containing protein [Nitrosopumilaceae archaeon]|jgi:hypothetical protein|nr:XkdF-like putative serine protease domain-containing protein [Nitrosopumilaceae archaeon]